MLTVTIIHTWLLARIHLTTLALFEPVLGFVYDTLKDDVREDRRRPRLATIRTRVSLIFRQHFPRRHLTTQHHHPEHDIDHGRRAERRRRAITHAAVDIILGPSACSLVDDFSSLAEAFHPLYSQSSPSPSPSSERQSQPSSSPPVRHFPLLHLLVIFHNLAHILLALWHSRHSYRDICRTRGAHVSLFDYLLIQNVHGKRGVSAVVNAAACVACCVGVVLVLGDEVMTSVESGRNGWAGVDGNDAPNQKSGRRMGWSDCFIYALEPWARGGRHLTEHMVELLAVSEVDDGDDRP